MSGPCRNPGAVATSGTAQVFGLSTSDVRSIDVIRRVARAIWPKKTAQELSFRTGMSVRACEHWLGQRCGLSADALAALLRSDAGLQFLDGLIAPNAPAWWEAFRADAELAQIKLRLDDLQERKKRLRRSIAKG